MNIASRSLESQERAQAQFVRQIADQAFSRAAGAQLIEGNHVRILKDAQENYPAWLDAIRSARHCVNFESYIIHDDDLGDCFAEALISKAREGVYVRLIYDWVGALAKTSRRFWRRLARGGVEVRCYNPPRVDSPVGWISRDHRKMLSADGEIAFVSGLCVGRMWVGYPERNIGPWRDTGVEVRGPAVAEVDNAFLQVWKASAGPPSSRPDPVFNTPGQAGNIALRAIATIPNTAGLFRLDQLIAALARRRLWLTDAYYAGTTPYVHALRAAARDGVDVRLLVPSGTDIPILRPLSRAGYRPLLEAGIRVFEWNGPMLHAKTAVADGRWSRVGSTNLNLQSWIGNYELDVMVEDDEFAQQMEEMYDTDLSNATEVVLDKRHKLQPVAETSRSRPMTSSGTGSAGRAVAGALRVSNTISAAIGNRRVLQPVEARIMITVGLLLLILSAVVLKFPRSLVYPVVIIALWFALALLYRGLKLYRLGKREPEPSVSSAEENQSAVMEQRAERRRNN